MKLSPIKKASAIFGVAVAIGWGIWFVSRDGSDSGSEPSVAYEPGSESDISTANEPGPAGDFDLPEVISFNQHVRPILSNNCFSCHGPDANTREADLRLDTELGATTAIDGFKPIVAGKPEESPVIQRIMDEDPDFRMPPATLRTEDEVGRSVNVSYDPLDPREIAVLKRWIEQGAEYEDHWAYLPLERPEVPEVENTDWPANPLDHFILSKMERHDLAPSPEADPVTLLRRVTLDLTGLPPTPAELDAFLADDDPGAYARVVDRLLASDAFGERMAVHWLDQVRYADTVGYHGDQTVQVWAFRDYVIRAFNDNKPFDEFTREQLGGDLMEDPTEEQLIASGFNRLNQTTAEGGAQEKEYLTIYMADRIAAVGNAFMGATMSCAQCHDHKFDPYTIVDYYALGAFFNDLEQPGVYDRKTDYEPTLTLTDPEAQAEIERLEKEIEKLDAVVREHEPESEPEIHAAKLKKLEEKRAQLAAIKENSTYQTLIARAREEPRETRVLPRGDWQDDSGEVVEPAVPEFLGAIDRDGRANRLDLANWLLSEENPLLGRAMMNRYWSLFYGHGLSRLLDDMGGQGEYPTHPELLDWLAVEFRESGWDNKHMVRLMVTTSTYRQSSMVGEWKTIDPENRFFSRQERFRLPAEFIRDNALAAAGLLNRELFGPPIKPYQPDGHYQHLNFPKRTYDHDTDHNQWRRGVYMHWQRTFLHPMLAAFDAPSRESCTAARAESNTPLQALVLLNDPSLVEAARVMAEHLLARPAEDPEARITWAFRRATAREPESAELAVLLELLESHRAHYTANPSEAEMLLQVGIWQTDENVDPVELAAWTSVTRSILNLHETITRN